jgi:serine/threonine protein kinase
VLEGNFSSEFVDFVSCCLQKDPNDRKTAAALLKHSFLQSIASPPDSLLEMIQERIDRMNQVDEIDAILDYGSRPGSCSNSRISHRKSLDSGGWDFDVLTLKKNASVSSYDEYGYGLDSSNAGKLHLRRDQSYNSLKSNKSSHSNPNSVPSSSLYRGATGSVSSNAAGLIPAGASNHNLRKLQIRHALMRAESDASGDDGCKESKYVTNIRLEGMILSGDRVVESEIKQDAKELPYSTSSSFSFSPSVTPRGVTPPLPSTDLIPALQCLQKILDRNQKVSPSELYLGVLEPTLLELERLTDEMKGDSEATRQETKVLISLLRQILIGLDKHTDSGLISSFISTVIGFAMDDDGEDLEDLEDLEGSGDLDQS